MTERAEQTALLVRESTVHHLDFEEEPNAETLIQQETQQWQSETLYPPY